MKKHFLLVATLTAVLLLGLLPAVAVAQDGPKFQICMAIDGSSSIAPEDFEIMLEGIASAVEDPECTNQEGLIELTIVQFSDFAAIEVGPAVITDGTVPGVAAQIRGIVQMDQATNIGDAFAQCTDALLGSRYFGDAERQFINLSTDGVPTEGEPNPETWAITARNEAIAAGVDEIDAEAIGPGADAEWLRLQIVYPQPGRYLDPDNPKPGWVDTPATFESFAAGLCNKFRIVDHEDGFVPEASSLILLASGLMGVAGYAGLRLRKK